MLGLTDAVAPRAPILAPGFGPRAPSPPISPRCFGALAPYVIASESRSILAAGPDGLARAHRRERSALYRGGLPDG